MALFSSFGLTLLAIYDPQSPYIKYLAAIPAIAIIFEKQFKFIERGNWNWFYRRKLIILFRDAKSKGLSAEIISSNLNAIELEMDE